MLSSVRSKNSFDGVPIQQHFEEENLGESEEATADRRRQFEALLDDVPDWKPADAKEFSEAVKVFEEVDEKSW